MASAYVDASLVSDITTNLPSLQFSTSLWAAEAQLCLLRSRSHALTVAACANVSFFVGAVNEARTILAEINQPHSGNASGLLSGNSTAPRDPISVGLIGCGRLGTQLIRSLLHYSGLVPGDISISTRRPETLGEQKAKGVHIVNNNVLVASSVDVLFLVVPPAAVGGVARQIKGQLRLSAVVVSLVACVPVAKLNHILGHDHIIKPEFYWEPRNESKEWSIQNDVVTSMQDETKIEMTCPLSTKKKDSVVCTRAKIAEQYIYAFVNILTSMGQGIDTTLNLLHICLLGSTAGIWQDDASPSPSPSPLRLLCASDLTKGDTSNGFFPVFDLTSVAAHETPLTLAIRRQAKIRQGFVNKFKETFETATKVKLKVKVAPTAT